MYIAHVVTKVIVHCRLPACSFHCQGLDHTVEHVFLHCVLCQLAFKTVGTGTEGSINCSDCFTY